MREYRPPFRFRSTPWRTAAFLFAALLAVGQPTPVAAQPAKDPVFDLQAILAPPLKCVLKTTEKNGIVTEEVRFHSEMDGAKSVDIFAYFSYPKGCAATPGVHLEPGRFGTGNNVLDGVRRGARLCDAVHRLPDARLPFDGRLSDRVRAGVAGGSEEGTDLSWRWRRCGPCRSLESRAEVDKNKIGMAGSSWGGFFTTLMVGVDPRLKCGSCMFGCGGLHGGNLWWDGRGGDKKRDEAFRKRWAETLDPAWRLPHTKTPIAWFTGTNDQFYWLHSVMVSYNRAAGPKLLSLLPNFQHALTPEVDEQVFAWLDAHLRGKPAFLKWSGWT